jgi:hypothetical protein
VLLKQGLQFVTDDPGRYLLLSFSRIPEYIKFWPDPASGLISNFARVGSFGLFLPFMLVGLLWPVVNFGRSPGESLWKRPSASVALLYLFVLVYSAIHILSWALIRYRLPVDAVLVIFAAFTLADLSAVGEKWLQRQRMLQKRTS